MSVKFYAYSSIENHYREKYIEEVLACLDDKIDKEEFVCTEKIHGSNMQFYAYEKDGKIDIMVGKRKSMVGVGTKFFPVAIKQVREKYDETVKEIYKICKKKFEDVQSIILYGELYGGFYPLKKPGFEQKHKPIQKGIYYCDKYNFYAFDLALVTKKDGEEKTKYIPFKDFEEIMKESKFENYSKVLFKGKIKECLDFDIKFKTTIPKIHNLPELDKSFPQLCEGVVIKPFESVLYNRSERIIIKKKNKEFLEVAPKITKKKEKVKSSDAFLELWEDLNRYCTKQRLDNVISKMGEVTIKMMGKLIGALSKDTLEEFNKDFSGWEEKISKKEQKELTRKLSTKCSVLCREYFKKEKK